MLTGRRAFAGETASDTIAAILEREPDWTKLPAAAPAHVWRLLRRCLQKDSNRRLRDIGDARLELDEALSSPPQAGLQKPAVMTRRTAISALAGAAVGAATGVFCDPQLSRESSQLDAIRDPNARRRVSLRQL